MTPFIETSLCCGIAFIAGMVIPIYTWVLMKIIDEFIESRRDRP